MASSRGEFDLPRDREVAYFVKLHLDTIVRKGDHPRNGGEAIYSVDGKPRPMLVLQRLQERERGKLWFLVLPVTSAGLDGNEKPKASVQPIGNCIDKHKDSFVEMDVQKLPDNMIVRGSVGEVRRLAPCDPLTFMNVVKIVEHKVLKHGRS